MGPVWEANHVWLIFVLVVFWTAYPVAFGSISSTLAAPLLIAAIGIIFRGAAYALRGQGASRVAENVLAVSSLLTPFALGTAVGAIATGRVPVGNAAGNPVTTWLNPACVLIGALAVVFSAYLAAVYLAADSVRSSERAVATPFRHRALAAGLASGGLALAGLLVMRHSGLDLTHGAALAAVCVSGGAGLLTLVLCWRSRFGLARLTAALSVAAVVVGWAAAQAPRLLPGMTVVQAAAGRSTLVALIIAVCCGAVVLIPSLALLFTLFLRGELDIPEHDAPAAEAVGPSLVPGASAPASPPPGTPPPASPAPGTPAPASPAPGTLAPASPAPGTPAPRTPAPRTQLRNQVRCGVPDCAVGVAADGRGRGGEADRGGDVASQWGRGRVGGAVVGLAAGTGLLVFSDSAWAHAVGVCCLVACAVLVFLLAVTSAETS
jgi:cytochrome d ubiquinol oxidase subunit II